MNSNDKNDRLAALRAKMKKDSQRGFDGRKDREDFWQTPNGESTVRLVQHPSDESEIIPYYNHAFQEKQGWFIEDCPATIGQLCPVWFIEDCPATIGQLCPVCSAGRKGHENKQYSIANVFVPATGAVLWWKFGVQILDVIEAGERAGVNPFDPIQGANLVVVKSNYTRSRFLAASPLGTEEEIAKIMAKCRPLSRVLNLKPYAELKAKYERIVGSGAAVQKTKK